MKRRIFAAATLFVVLLWAFPAFAERVIVLSVPDGGTSKLVAKIASNSDINVKDQKWFLRQVRKRGLKPKKILSRPKDLKRVLKGGKADFIVAVAPKEGDKSTYEGRIIDKTGEVVRMESLERTGEGLTDADAELMVNSLLIAMGRVEEESGDESSGTELLLDEDEDEDEEGGEEDESDGDEEEELPPEPSGETKNFLWLELQPQLVKHDVTFAGTSGALLTRNSSFYPGVQLDAEIYVGALIPDSEAAGAGIFLGAMAGFDSVTFANEDGEEQTDGLLHLELEGGLLYRADTPLENRSTTNLRARFRITGKHIQYSVDSPGLPSTSMTTINIAGKVAYPLFFDNFALEGTVTFVPVGFFGEGSKLFGQSSLIYGFGTQLGAIYGIGDFFGIKAGYGFRLLRTQFDGLGSSEFSDTQSFDLVQGLQVGLAVQF